MNLKNCLILAGIKSVLAGTETESRILLHSNFNVNIITVN